MTSDGVPIVIDSGASTSVTPFREDFVDHIIRLDNQKVDGITKEAVIEGVGPVKWTFFDDFGNKGVMRTMCFYMPNAKIRLFSPQKYLMDKKSEGECVLTKEHCTMVLDVGCKLRFTHDKYNNLPFANTHPPLKASSNFSSFLDPIPADTSVNALLHEE